MVMIQYQLKNTGCGEVIGGLCVTGAPLLGTDIFRNLRVSHPRFKAL